jgi:hypothetical protein
MVIGKTIDRQLRKTQRRGLDDLFGRFTGLKGYEFTSRDLKIELDELLKCICAFSKAASVNEQQYKILETS